MRRKVNFLICLVLMTTLLFTLVGCSSDKGTGQQSGQQGTEQKAEEKKEVTYPTKPVNLIIAFTAGGSSDVQARIVEKYWKEHFNNQPLVFDYKVGAGGQVGFTEITQAKPDGYTFGGINVPHIVFQALSKQATFKTDDFAYICQVVKDPLLLVVGKDSPINSVEEFIAEANAKAGKMNVGIVGPFTAHHVGIFQLSDELGITVNPVIYQGAADQNVALMGGHVEAMLGNLNDVMRDLNSFKILAIASEERHEWIPDVPTFKELDINFIADIRRAFAAPKNIDPNALQILRDGFEKICNDPAYLEDMEKIGQPADYLSGEDLEKYVKEYEAGAKEVIEKYGLN